MKYLLIRRRNDGLGQPRIMGQYATEAEATAALAPWADSAPPFEYVIATVPS